MLKRLNSKRFSRWPATITWIIALAASAWVAVDLVLLLTAPPRVAADYRPPADPAAAARTIIGSRPMALAESAPAAPTPSAYALVGVATGFGRDRGFALLRQAEGGVIPVTEGEALAPGVTLAKIHADRVDIDRAGVIETLPLESPAPPRAAPAITRKPDPQRSPSP